jgi:prepilin-type N-terminal cleavage/methylation domain-containing protein
MARRSAMTLTELMIAMALTSLVATAAITGILQMQVMTRRAEALMGMHDTARIIYERMSADIAAMQQTGCWFVTCTASSPTVPGTLEIVFLRAKYDQNEFSLKDSYGTAAPTVSDLTWTRWAWNGPASQITVASNPAYRTFTTAAGTPYATLPTPQQFTNNAAGTATPAAVLNRDAYGTGAAADVGDYQDLLNRAVPIAINCTAFRCDVVTQAAANSFSANPATGTLVFSGDGMRIDGLVNSGATADFGRRPRLIRIQFTLADNNLGISNTFSYSFQAPGLLAQ